MQLPDLFPGCRITSIVQHAQTLTVHAQSDLDHATCPQCGTLSHRIHEHYQRHPRDLSWAALAVQLELRVTRYRCLNPDCPTITFAERFQPLLSPHTQRTSRLEHVQAQLGLLLSAAGSVALLDALHIPCSHDTVLRCVKRLALPTHPTPRVLGVDDWALRKGQRYGTILVDLEQHRVVDLLLDRTVEVLAAWLEAHPGVEVVTRDRASEYSRAIVQAAPKVQQVADRFHLVQNLGTTVQAWLERRKKTLFETLQQLCPPRAKPPPPTFSNSYGPNVPRAHHTQAHREARLEQYDTALHLKAEGVRMAQIARSVGVPQSTVRWWFKRGEFPNRLGRHSTLGADHEAYLRERWAQGCSNVAELHRELLDRGFTGSSGPVLRFLGFVRAGERLEVTRSETQGGGEGTRLPSSAREVARLLVTPEVRLKESQRVTLDGLLKGSAELGAGYGLIQEFRGLLLHPCEGNVTRLNGWIEKARACGVSELQRFALGLQRDFRAVAAGLRLAWSNAQTEGQVTKLKLVKRQRYGRSGFELLRRCVLLT